MPILNYTTSIAAEKTVGEIQGILSRHGATRITVEHDGRTPVGLSFEIETRFGPRAFRLPAKIEGVLGALEQNAAGRPRRGEGKVTRSMVNKEHAARVAWRILLDGVAVYMAWVEAELVTVEEVLLPYMLDKSGQTMFEWVKARHLSLPGPERADR